MTKSKNTSNRKVNKGFKVRAYPEESQKEMIMKTLGSSRYIYNEFLSLNNFRYTYAAEKNQYDGKRKDIGYNFACGNFLPDHIENNYLLALKDTKPFLREVDSTILQQASRDLDAGFKNFFRRLAKYLKKKTKKSKETNNFDSNSKNKKKKKKKDELGFPVFKSKRNHRQTFRTTSKKHDLVNKTAYFPKIGNIKYLRSFKLPKDAVVTSKTFVMENNRFFIVFTCKDVPMKDLPKTGKVVGIDLGLKDAMSLSDGYKTGKIIRKKSDRRIARLDKKLSKQLRDAEKDKRKIEDCKNIKKTITKLNNAYYHKKNSIRNYIHKETIRIVRENDIIVIGDVSSALGLANHKIAKTTADQHWYEIKRQLEYKSKWYGKDFRLVDEKYSSKTCSKCGYVLDSLNLGVRQWTCPDCGSNHDRDTNAAKNILTVGLAGLENITKYVFGDNACGKTNING